MQNCSDHLQSEFFLSYVVEHGLKRRKSHFVKKKNFEKYPWGRPEGVKSNILNIHKNRYKIFIFHPKKFSSTYSKSA
jgi:hypothetical protein